MAAIEQQLPHVPLRVVQLERMPVLEQAQLFSGARVVVAPHGAGLGNTMFMPEGAAMVCGFACQFTVNV